MPRVIHPGWVSSRPAYGCPLLSTITHAGYIALKELGIVYDEASYHVHGIMYLELKEVYSVGIPPPTHGIAANKVEISK